MHRTSVTPERKFLVGLHRPTYTVVNLRENDRKSVLGHTEDGAVLDNRTNFPPGDVRVPAGKRIYEIPNAFPFRGTTFIDSERADRMAADPAAIGLPPAQDCSVRKILLRHVDRDLQQAVLRELPSQVLYGLAATSTDPEELVQLANNCCRIEHDDRGKPLGLRYLKGDNGKPRQDIDDFELFETIANNPYLPDPYKEVMVLRPGIQGDSEIVGEWKSGNSHVFEYLRSNSYIPGGHFAPNMADNAIRYRTTDLSPEDMQGLRHLYYQRIYCTVAEKTDVPVKIRRRKLSVEELEELRRKVLDSVNEQTERLASLWGWNFGYDFSSSGYRLHASHQMIHQQCAVVPEWVATTDGTGNISSYSCGDLVADVIEWYHRSTGSDFFTDYLAALEGNERTDRKTGEQSLVVWEDENVVLFVPKAQISQWELQLMTKACSSQGPVGNVLEADTCTRQSLDRGILLAQHIFSGLQARMVTSIEYSKRVGLHNGQRLMYSFLPKLPWAMGAFSEAQLRFICGHYPEDFAACCRLRKKILTE